MKIKLLKAGFDVPVRVGSRAPECVSNTCKPRLCGRRGNGADVHVICLFRAVLAV